MPHPLAIAARSLLALALAGLPSAPALAAGVCADPPSGGSGGTSAPERGGIGGTGAPTELARGGIGGTGAPALLLSAGETAGVVGTITGFASICVNGLEIHYDDTTPVSIDGAAAHARALAVGQVVAVEAVGSGADLAARRITIVHAVVGPVGQLDARGFEVMGQRVVTVGDQPLPAAGATVRVAGLRDAEGTIVATRIDAATGPDIEHSVVGQVRNGRIGKLAIEAPGLHDGSEVLVRGRFAGDRLQVRSVERDPARVVVERAAAVSLELRIGERQGRQIAGGGHRIEIDDETRVAGGGERDAQRNRLIRVEARSGKDGLLRAERIEIRDRERRDERGGGDGERVDRDDRQRRDRERGREREERGERAERHDGGSHGGRGERIERPERPERPERVERPERD
jgi:hypothetical protein